MKVALLTNFIPPYRKSLYQNLSNKVDDLTVFVSVEMENNRSWEVDNGELNVVVQKNLSYKKIWKYNFETQVHIPYDTIFQLKRLQPDIVISVELGMRSLFSAIYSKVSNKPLVLWLALSEHTEKNRKGLRLKLRKFLLNSCSAILCNGESSKKYIESYGVKKKLFFIPCTSDYMLGEPKKDFNSTNKKILYTGHLIQLKGIKEMVEGLISWALKNESEKIELIIAGDGPEKEHFKKLNEIPNIEYQLLGHVDYEELKSWYKKVDIYLFPTLQDEWGVVVNESFSNGVPVVGSIYSQAVVELIDNQKTGWLYDPLEPNSFTKAFETALNTDKNKLEEMSNNCLKAIAELTPEKVGSSIIEAVEHALRINNN